MAETPREEVWDDFVDWCQPRGLTPVPANPWTLAAYLRYCERVHRPTAIQKRMRQIGAVLFEKSRKRPDRHPTVMRTMDRIKESHTRKKQKAPPPLFSEDDFTSAEKPKKTEPKKAAPKKAAKAKTPAKSAKPAKVVRSLRGTPKLVRKRKP